MRAAGPLPDGRIPVVLSVHDAELMTGDAAAIAHYVAAHHPTMAEVSSTLLRTRRIRRHRSVLRAGGPDELVDALRAVAAGVQHPLVACSSRSAPPRTAFVFPGQGNQWPGMGLDAYRRLAEYRAEADRCEALFARTGVSPVGYLLADPGDARSRTQAQAAQFTHAVALARVWQSCGVWPDLTIGHSLGEVAAAYVAGTVGLPAAVDLVVARAAVLDGLPARYAMAVLGVDADTAAGLAASVPGWLEVSVVNSPGSTAISGDAGAVAEAVRRLQHGGRFARQIAVDYPAHTSALAPFRDDLLRRLPAATFADSPVEFVGSARGEVVQPGTDFRTYWYDNLRNTVRFDRAVATARSRGADVFIEMSAHAALIAPLTDLVDDDTVLLASLRRDDPAVDHLSAAIAAAAGADPAYRWADLLPAPAGPPLRGFPHAPMRAVHLWIQGARPRPATQPLLGNETWALTSPPTPPARRIAVVGAAGADTSVLRALGNAITRHPAAEPAAASAADVFAVVAPATVAQEITIAAAALTELVAAGMLDYGAAPRCQSLWFLTARGERVRPTDPPVAPLQAALAAMHRSVGYEHTDTAFAHLDLPDWAVGDDLARLAVDTMLGEPGEAALRRHPDGRPQRYERSLRLDAAAPEPLPSNAFDDVVITGGAGGVGIHLARYCATRGTRRIMLLGRRGANPGVVESLRRNGTDVTPAACDVTDPAAVAAAAAEHAHGGASLLIHAAGSAVLADAVRLSAADFRNTLHAKINGLTTMLEHWPLRPGCRIVLCSSASAVWGGQGHAAYAAANRLLDAAAQRLRADGYDAVSVRSGLWQDTGIVDTADIERIRRSGLRPMSGDLAAAAMLRAHADDPLILDADLDRLNLFFASHAIKTGAAEPPAAPLRYHASHRPGAEVVRAELAATLKLDVDDIDLGAGLIDMGVDSLLAVDLRRRLRHATGRAVPLATLLGGISGAELAAHLDAPDYQPEGVSPRD